VKTAFCLFLGIHVAFSLFTFRDPAALKKKRVRLIHVLSQGPLLWVSIYFGAVYGVFSRQLVSPVYIGWGLLVGHLIFAASLLITHRSLEDTWSHLFDFGPIWNFSMRSPFVLSRFVGGAVAEELIYRAAAQPIMIGFVAKATGQGTVADVVGIGFVAGVFVLVHKDFFSNTRWQGAEFVGFAILLGVLYHLTGSFILVTVIHAVRNIEIAYLEYLAKVEELGDEERAAREVERGYMRVSSEQT
jgi:membrane protease YdiL (CAAX protease family)